MVKRSLSNLLILSSIILILVIPQNVLAHAILEKANPTPDSILQTAPSKIVLSFNERLEKELYSIKVFDDQGEVISKNKTKMSIDQKELQQKIPTLSNGRYTISYQVLSADGHPVKGSYVISVGEVADASIRQQNELHNEQKGSSLATIIQSVVRVLYYIALLFVTGWVLWEPTVRKLNFSQKQTSYRQWTTYLLFAFLTINLVMGALNFNELLDTWTLKGIEVILTETTAGISWTIFMVLSTLGFAILHRNNWLDRLWVVLLLGAKSVNGHALAFDPPLRTISIDIVHLLAAAIWVGGLFYMVVCWKQQREHVRQFMLIFSKAALISIIVLIVTGLASTLIFLPKPHYILYTQWGIWLLVKIALVFCVILIGGILRFSMKKNKEHVIGNLIKVDFTIMILVVGIVGIFTHLSPLPQNQSLEWHKHEKGIELATFISPKVPGYNMFMVAASSDKPDVAIKRIELF